MYEHHLDSEDIMTILRVIELYEDDQICDAPILVVESGFDRWEVDEILDQLWREDQIECRAMTSGNEPMLTGIRRVAIGAGGDGVVMTADNFASFASDRPA